ncbi:MAG: rhomboid family intramembrane serine protease [Pseudomonadales bacterium]|nr:rhomboid family intramembrane serine protease [Pseudomonadales bacterium]
MIKALEIKGEQDLRGFSILMNRRGLPHRISEVSGAQVIWVPGQQEAQLAVQLYSEFQRGDFTEELSNTRKPVLNTDADGWLLLLQFARFPVTLFLVVVCIVVVLITQLGSQLDVAGALTFLKVTQIQGDLLLSMPEGQPWRLITPIFLHFSMLHIAFNMLWLWELGRRIELVQGSVALLFLVFLIGVASNIAQAIAVKGGLFGGMSGVIYGLLGYCWLWSYFSPRAEFILHKGVVFFLLFWLVLGYSGVITMLGFGAIANTAHASGLVTGLVIAAVCVLFTRSMAYLRK